MLRLLFPEGRELGVILLGAALAHHDAHAPIFEFREIAATGILIAPAEIDVVNEKTRVREVETQHIANRVREVETASTLRDVIYGWRPLAWLAATPSNGSAANPPKKSRLLNINSPSIQSL